MFTQNVIKDAFKKSSGVRKVIKEVLIICKNTEVHQAISLKGRAFWIFFLGPS